MIDATHEPLQALQREIVGFGRRQPACRALIEAHWGVGGLVAVAVWAHLGDCARFGRSDQAVRHSGLDVTVHSSDRSRSAGRLSRQGPPVLRWALFEAGKCAARRASPDYELYQSVKARQGGKRATMTVARKIARRCYHTLRGLAPGIVYAEPT
jgi:transposase